MTDQHHTNVPDYQGQGIVNLMASILRARGGASEYADLAMLPATDLRPARHLILWVIDGLGDRWLQRHAPDGLLSQHRIGSMTSVFPSTTTTAITTYLTGVAPQQHALTGWHTWVRELGTILTVLPGRPRYGGVSYRQAGMDLASFFTLPPLADQLNTPVTLVSPASIAQSDFNRAHLGRGRLRPYEKLGGLVQETVAAVKRARQASYVYVYWSMLDHIGHEHGMESTTAQSHLRALESALAELLDRLQGSDSMVLVTADHGHIDTRPEDHVRLEDHPELQNCLALPLCGEGRAAFCYLRSGYEHRFLDYYQAQLATRFALYPSTTLVEQGWFGLGAEHPRLRDRIGDYTLIGRRSHLIRDRLVTEKPFQPIGVHGGLSADEMWVPLSVIPT